MPGAGRRAAEAAEPPKSAAHQLPECIGGRYHVQAELGRGGMAVVYRVLDSVRGRVLALKQLALPHGDKRFREQAAAFEREYHMLMQLSHPRIIEVYDFGSDDGGRYYTMELLDGGDLRERSPMPWQEACALGYDVCSSLALLHSRQLLHRDISPRNVRSTRDGSAKLIDFGAMVPMGTSGQVVGTPPFVPPEVLHRSTLDARTDLFAFGATLYYALTGRLAYATRDFAGLKDAWRRQPPAPSVMVPGIPEALDALVLSLLSLDPALRPRSAFEVMQKLSGIAGLERSETVDVTRAYLSTPVMVGREQQLDIVRGQIEQALAGRGAGMLITGAAGAGRSRLLDACALQAKIAGAAVLRANAATASAEVLGAGQSLAEQLLDALPEIALTAAQDKAIGPTLFESMQVLAGTARPAVRPRLKQLTGVSGDSSAIQTALSAWLIRVASLHPLAILIDDLERIDAASCSLLAALVLAAPQRSLLLVATTADDSPLPARDAFAVWKRECLRLPLCDLSRDESEALLRSVFGDVPNLALVADRIYGAAVGNPRDTLELVRQLIASGHLRYEGGRWLLPARLEAAELPSSGAEACRRRVAELSQLARLLGQAHALASHPTLTRQDHALLARDVPALELDAAITELLSQRVLIGDGTAFSLARREWSDALLAELDAEGRRARHRLLAELYAEREGFAVERVHQLLAAEQDGPALELLRRLLAEKAGESIGILSMTRMSTDRVAQLLDCALTRAERCGLPRAVVHEFRRSLVAISIPTDEAYYTRAAPAWFAQVARDSGLADYRADAAGGDPMARLMRALTAAGERYAATPEAERVSSPEVAIKDLAYYVSISIAIGSRTQDCALIRSLPTILEPFAPLSPLLHAIWQNAIATCETMCDNRPEQARKRWREVDAVLEKVTAAEVHYVALLRGAIAYGIGLAEARLGMQLPANELRRLDQDPFQRVSAISLRRIVCLHKGDSAGAERYRKQAEQMALQANLRQMFTSTLSAELSAHALASDLTGLRESIEAIAPLAARFPGWAGYLALAEGCYEQARGQLEPAALALERGLRLAEPDPADPGRCTGAWPRLEGAYLEVLVSLDRAAEAKARGDRALARCAELGIDIAALVIRRALALAEAKLGDYAGASRRLDAVIDALVALEIRGLELGACYEARTRIAIWSSDTAAIERFGRSTAAEYRYGEGSALGARYDRLMLEARSCGVVVLPRLSDFQSRLTTAVETNAISQTAALVRERLANAASLHERARQALALVCENAAKRSGHLYLQTAAGLELVASYGGSNADDQLHALAIRYLAEQLDSDCQATMVESQHQPRREPQVWVDQRGVTHRPALLLGDADGGKGCVGVAVLEAGDGSTSTLSSQQLLDSIASCLLPADGAS